MTDKTQTRRTAGMDASLCRKLDACRSILRRLGGVVVAFSGGVDSSMLLALAVETLGARKVLAVTAVSPIFPQSERRAARKIAGRIGAEYLEIQTRPLADPNFSSNPADRCFHCKMRLLGRLKQLAEQRGWSVVTGTNADDGGDYRPGLDAERHMQVGCPLAEAGLKKADIRAAAGAMGLASRDRPSSACLASRVPYGREITAALLRRIERAEAALRDMGFAACRVRDYEPVARIEVPADQITQAVSLRQAIVKKLKALGYTYVTLDLEGFRSGSMNETL